ncbi:MAG: imidazolonepropionase [Acidobacteriota bacterium]
MISADLIVAGCDQLLTCRGPAPKRKNSLKELGLIKNGSIASKNGKIVFVGSEKELKRKVIEMPGCIHIDGRGRTCLPGLVDSHTHLPFAGSREQEFLLRLKGKTYLELAEKGMGIQSTVQKTRQASKNELLSLCKKRLDTMLLHGTTTVEAKSGYGLNLKDEIKQLEVLKQADKSHPVDIISTFMGAHEVPKEYQNKKNKYIKLLTQKIIPAVKKKNLAEFFDVFCEQGIYSIQETRALVRTAKKAGFKIKIHADEFTSLGGAQLAAEEKAASAEHLIAINEKGIQKIAKASTAAVLLPGVPFFLMQNKRAPARSLIDSGAAVALATDFNPGSSMTESLLFIMQLGVYTMNMSVEESINAVTLNAAYAVDRHKQVGSLEQGKKMDVILCEAPNYPYLVYHFGINLVTHVIKDGKVVVKNRTLIQ